VVQFRPAWCVQAYLRICKIPNHVENRRFPGTAAGGPLPQLHCGDRIVPKDEGLRYIRENYHDLNSQLSNVENAQATAFESLVVNDLEQALEWSRWGQPEHYRCVTRKALLAILPFPLNYGWTWYTRKAVLYRLAQHHRINDQASAKRVAESAYAALAEQLGNKPWFYGKPSSLDCVVFGHLMDALREPIGSIVFRQHPNLVAFCERLQKELFDNPSSDIVAICTCSTQRNLFSDAQGFNTVYGKGNLQVLEWASEMNEDKIDEENAEISPSEKEFDEGSQNAIIFAGGVIAMYLVFSNVIAFKLAPSRPLYEEDGEE